MPACPYCTDTRRYTDALTQVRCTNCLNVVNDQAATTSTMRLQDLDAPMTVGTHAYPQPITTKYSR